ncbi:putative hydrophobic protein (TIGR00341 family) [Rhodococcus sp. SMB37]|uniref:TIGR00341 family protein n=1 Tax=Rhodococcus sp. SMB37 TaxID=2512213 RepID=UPI0006D1ABF4|nr:TIGR00341 family protein [Rhodococcus sp. SMB37]TCN46761.1 putative hydrophobic protein (TIGR00341 family) [Rhodococcus sp. SMB37]
MSILVPDSQRRTLDELVDRLDLSAGESASKRSAFWIMLTLSAVIAASGVAGDSTATVIGAMIVAPLSVPILGVGLGVASGRGELIVRSLLLVLAGIVLVVAVGFLVSQLLPNPTNVLSNSQVVGRTSPKLMDLTAALATGLVGVVAITRRDVSDVLPGVAIAISLVPPLAVVGVCLGSGAPGLAFGAFVLFASNMVAMIVTATVVLVIVGFAREAGAGEARRGRAYAVLAVALIIVAAPMVVNSLSSLWAGQIAEATGTWLGDDPNSQVTDVSLQQNTATIHVLAPDGLPPVDELQQAVDNLVPWHLDVVVVHTVGGRVTQ